MAVTRASQPARTFADLGVPATLVAALADAGITTPFPIQTATLPDSLAGRDVLGRGRTGSGKTYAFVLPGARPARGRPRPAAPPEPAPRADPRPDPRAGQPDRRGARAARRGRSACARSPSSAASAPSPQISGAARRRRHRRRLPGPARRPRRRPATPTSTRSRSPCSTRPTTWPTSASCPSYAGCSTRRPRDGQRMLFSATLDAGVDVLVKRFLHNPVTHSVDSAQSPVAADAHHVLHVQHRRPVAGAGRPHRRARARRSSSPAPSAARRC